MTDPIMKTLVVELQCELTAIALKYVISSMDAFQKLPSSGFFRDLLMFLALEDFPDIVDCLVLYMAVVIYKRRKGWGREWIVVRCIIHLPITGYYSSELFRVFWVF